MTTVRNHMKAACAQAETLGAEVLTGHAAAVLAGIPS